MLYPSGCLNPITLHICLIMFTGRLDTVHCHIRIAVLMRADLTALPLVIQPPCDRLRYPVTSQLYKFYFLSDLTINAAHSVASANASQTCRLMASPYAMLHALNTAHLSSAAPLVLIGQPHAMQPCLHGVNLAIGHGCHNCCCNGSFL